MLLCFFATLWREIEDKIDHYVLYRVFFLCEATEDAGD